jgi:glucokinase
MSNLYHYAGIDIGATNIKFGLVNSNGEVIYRQQKPTMVDKGAKPLLHLITNIAENLLLRAAEDDLTINWLGVGTPGTVDNLTGTVTGASPNIPDWVGTEIGSHLKEHLNLPVYVDNDANVMTLAEYQFGAAKRFNSVVCVTVGTGIGCGIIIDGNLWRGSTNSAGELGHLTIKFDGKECLCENKGCLEAYCSARPMVELAATKLKNSAGEISSELKSNHKNKLSIKKIFSAARKNDPIAHEVIEETGRLLGIGLAGVVNLLNPDAIILGGGIIDGGAGFIEVVGAEIRRLAFPSATEDLRILKAELGNDAGFIGAALLGEYKSKRS